MAEISIIVPCFNAGELLEPCLQSVRAQTFDDWELIVVDDASADGSAALVERQAAADRRVRLVSLAQNAGVSAARNRGLAEARGRYVAFLDADDRLAPTFLQRLHRLAEHTECPVVGAAFERVAPGAVVAEGGGSGRPRVLSAVEAVQEVLYQTGVLDSSVCGKLFRRELFAQEPFRPGRFEDLDIIYRVLLRAGSVAWLPRRLYLYTVNPSSFMQTFAPERAVAVDVTERMVEFMEKGQPELVAAARDRALSAAFNVFALLKHHRCSMPEVEERCRAVIRRYRWQSLTNPRVRLKNKLAILATYLGGFGLIAFAARSC